MSDDVAEKKKIRAYIEIHFCFRLLFFVKLCVFKSFHLLAHLHAIISSSSYCFFPHPDVERRNLKFVLEITGWRYTIITYIANRKCPWKPIIWAFFDCTNNASCRVIESFCGWEYFVRFCWFVAEWEKIFSKNFLNYWKIQIFNSNLTQNH